MNFLTHYHKQFTRLSTLLILLGFMLFATGCTTAWIGEASNIVALLLPAAGGILGILGALGGKVPASTLTLFTTWTNKAESALGEIRILINQYNAAEATAKPGILAEIETLVATVTQSLDQILPLLNITDPATQEKVTAVVQLFQSELTALLNIIPVISGAVTPAAQGALRMSTAEAHTRIVAVMPAKTFQKKWNSAVDEISVVAPEVQKGKFHVGHNPVVGALEEVGEGLGNAVGEAKFGE